MRTASVLVYRPRRIYALSSQSARTRRQTKREMNSTAFAFATKKYCSHYVNFDLSALTQASSPFQCFLSPPLSMARPSNTLLLFLFLCWPSLAFALDIRQTLTRLAFWRRSSRNVPAAGYVNPNDNGGSMLTVRTPPRGFVPLALTEDV